MKILVITPPQQMQYEVETIHELFRNGLEILHLRKPDYKSVTLEILLQKMDSKYHHRIMLHTHHHLSRKYQLRGLHFPAACRQQSDQQLHSHQSTSCHSINELATCSSRFEYVMVSPVFDSISKPGYCAGIKRSALQKFIWRSGRQVVALGGVTPESLLELPKDCWGAAVLGCVWQHDTVRERLRSFEKLRAGAEQL